MFCKVKTQFVGKTLVFRQAQPTVYTVGFAFFLIFLSAFFVIVEKGMQHTAGLVAGHHVQIDRVDAVEDAVLDAGIVAAQTAQQSLDLLALGTAAAVVAHGAVFGEAARALDEFQLVVLLPRDDVLLVDAVERADELHPGEVRAVQLGQHGLHLRAVEHAHDRGFDNVVEMMTEGDLVAAERLRLAVQIAAAHTGAQVARVLLAVVRDGKDVGFENRDRNVQQRGVALDFAAVDFVVAGVHDEENDLERDLAVPLEQLHQLRHQHGVLAARNTDRDFIARLNELIPADGERKRVPDGLAEFLDDAAFDQLMRF